MITIGYLASRKGSRKPKDWKRSRVLLDSGCGATLINKSLLSKLKIKQTPPTKWVTKGGEFNTSKKCEVFFTLPAFHEHREIKWNCFVEESNPNSNSYDIIIGRDLLHELGIDLCFSTAKMTWDNTSIPMQSVDKLHVDYVDVFEQELLYIHDPITTDAERIQNIMDNKYCLRT